MLLLVSQAYWTHFKYQYHVCLRGRIEIEFELRIQGFVSAMMEDGGVQTQLVLVEPVLKVYFVILSWLHEVLPKNDFLAYL